VGPGRARDRAKIPAGIRNTCKAPFPSSENWPKSSLGPKSKERAEVGSIVQQIVVKTAKHSHCRQSRVSIKLGHIAFPDGKSTELLIFGSQGPDIQTNGLKDAPDKRSQTAVYQRRLSKRRPARNRPA
jgi:hypothetical protein